MRTLSIKINALVFFQRHIAMCTFELTGLEIAYHKHKKIGRCGKPGNRAKKIEERTASRSSSVHCISSNTI